MSKYYYHKQNQEGGIVNMKRFVLISCLVLLMVCFARCGKAPEEGKTSEEPAIETTTEEVSTEEAEATDSMAEEGTEEAPAPEDATTPEPAPEENE